jgi:hypothetical protein
MRTAFCLLIAALLATTPALAEEFSAIKDKKLFLNLVKDRELRIGMYGLTLKVLPDGRIEGSALGRDVTGKWAWKDGYFCREMRWGKREIPYNCQLVEAQGESIMRFTVDQGRGDSADFRLR